jgi:hypothetical protein
MQPKDALCDCLRAGLQSHDCRVIDSSVGGSESRTGEDCLREVRGESALV